MLNAYDLAYYAALGATWPAWAIRRRTREKVRDAFASRVGRARPRKGNNAAVLVHAVSVGELNAARALVDAFQSRRPGLHVIVTTTTTAGDALARERYAGRADVTVLRFPLDLSPAIDRLLDATRPAMVVLMELEVWPNFMRHCADRKIPVVVANGRVTEPSCRKYRLLGPIGAAMFGRLAAAIVQSEAYAERFVAMGVPRERVDVAGTMKFDAAPADAHVDGADALARDLGLDRGEPLFVAGSTGPGEEAIVLDVYRAMLAAHPSLRLALVPRKPDRFDDVARLIVARGFDCVSRSTTRDDKRGRPGVVLIDTMGELRKAYALARVAFVGRTLVDLGPKQHGSDMIEPCALGVPTIVGPFTGNFEEPMRALRAADAIVEVNDESTLREKVGRLLSDRAASNELGERSRHVVHAGRGALERHLAILLPILQGDSA